MLRIKKKGVIPVHLVAENGWGVPNTSRESFNFLTGHGVLEEELAGNLKARVGFRNIAIYDYQKMNLEILQELIETHLGDLSKFAKITLQK